MRKLWILSALIYSSNVMAALVPSTLPDGKYSINCQTITVEKYDTPTHSGADANGIVRRVEHQSGTSIFITSGDLTTVKETYSIQGDDFSAQGEYLNQKTVKAIGENQFEEVGTITDSLTLPGKKNMPRHTSTTIQNWKRTFFVQDNFEVNLKSKNGDEPEAPGRSETVVLKNSDSSYDIVNYIREGFHRELKAYANGAPTSGKFIYQVHNSCRYTPSK